MIGLYGRSPRELSAPPGFSVVSAAVLGMGAEGGPLPAIPPLPDPMPSDFRREFVSGTAIGWYNELAALALPWAYDEITSDFGVDVYERMMRDGIVSSSVGSLIASVVEEGMTYTPAVVDKTNSAYELATTIRDEAEEMLNGLTTPQDDVIADQLAAIWQGNTVAEITADDRPGVHGGTLLNVTSVKVKPLRSTAFVCDAFLNVVGLLSLLPGRGIGAMAGATVNMEDPPPNLLPREKFCILSFRPRNNDPRGRSGLSAAFRPWNGKLQMFPEYLKFLKQFGSPSLIGFTPTDPGFGPPPGAPAGTLTPKQALLQALLAFQNGTAMALAGGSGVQIVQSNGDGRAFLEAFTRFDEEIVQAILMQKLATQEGRHQSRAAATVHKDLLDTIVRQIKRFVQRAWYFDVLRPWVRNNWGRAAMRLTPHPTLGTTERHDLPALLGAVAAARASGYFYSQSQLAYVDELLGFPVRDTTVPPDLPQLPVKGTGAQPGTEPDTGIGIGDAKAAA